MLNYRKALLAFDRRVWLFIAAWGLVAFAYFGVIGVLFNLYLLRLGFDVAFIGLLIGSGQLIWGAAAFPSAAIGTRIGFQRALIISMAISALGSMLILLVESVPASLQPAWLLIT
jgi:MFS family permease